MSGGTSISTSNGQRTILVCRGTGCEAQKSEQVQMALEREVAQLGLTGIKVDLSILPVRYLILNLCEALPAILPMLK